MSQDKTVPAKDSDGALSLFAQTGRLFSISPIALIGLRNQYGEPVVVLNCSEDEETPKTPDTTLPDQGPPPRHSKVTESELSRSQDKYSHKKTSVLLGSPFSTVASSEVSRQSTSQVATNQTISVEFKSLDSRNILDHNLVNKHPISKTSTQSLTAHSNITESKYGKPENTSHIMSGITHSDDEAAIAAIRKQLANCRENAIAWFMNRPKTLIWVNEDVKEPFRAAFIASRVRRVVELTDYSGVGPSLRRLADHTALIRSDPTKSFSQSREELIVALAAAFTWEDKLKGKAVARKLVEEEFTFDGRPFKK